jgi:hypothetical protein
MDLDAWAQMKVRECFRRALMGLASDLLLLARGMT